MLVVYYSVDILQGKKILGEQISWENKPTTLPTNLHGTSWTDPLLPGACATSEHGHLSNSRAVHWCISGDEPLWKLMQIKHGWVCLKGTRKIQSVCTRHGTERTFVTDSLLYAGSLTISGCFWEAHYNAPRIFKQWQGSRRDSSPLFSPICRYWRETLSIPSSVCINYYLFRNIHKQRFGLNPPYSWFYIHSLSHLDVPALVLKARLHGDLQAHAQTVVASFGTAFTAPCL